jgi:hypothetical protein
MRYKPGKRISEIGRVEPFSASLVQSDHKEVITTAHPTFFLLTA